MSASTAESQSHELGNPGYELFIVGLSIVSLVNFAIVVLPVQSDEKTIARIVDVPISLILLVDFMRRLVRSHPPRAYFIGDLGWLDLLGSLPFAQLKIFRLFRVIRVVRLLRRYGGRKFVRSVLRDRADNALRIIGFLVIVLVEFGSMFVLAAERSAPNSNIKTGGEALWWAVVTVATVGYGDYYPVTALGRTFAVLIMATGIGLFGALGGYLANFFLSPSKEDSGAGNAAQSSDAIRRLEELEAQIAAELAAIRAASVRADGVRPEVASDTTPDEAG